MSLRRWLTRWLAALAFLGLGIVCSVIYFATTMSFIDRQDSTLGQYQKIVQHLIEEVATQGDIKTLQHKLDDFFLAASISALNWLCTESVRFFQGAPKPTAPNNDAPFIFRCLPAGSTMASCTLP